MSDIQSQVYCIVKRRPHDSEATKQSTSQIQKCCSANVHHPVCDAQDNQESRFMKYRSSKAAPPTPFSVFQSWVSNFASTISACFAPLDPRVIHQHIPSSDPTWVGKYLLKYHEISITNELSIAPQKVKIVIYFHWLSHVFRQKVRCSWFSPGVSQCILPFFHGKSTVFPAILP